MTPPKKPKGPPRRVEWNPGAGSVILRGRFRPAELRELAEAIETDPLYRAQITAPPKQKATFIRAAAKAGEEISSIAARFGVTVARVNQILKEPAE